MVTFINLFQFSHALLQIGMRFTEFARQFVVAAIKAVSSSNLALSSWLLMTLSTGLHLFHRANACQISFLA
jgi:hypothetical protein